MAARSKVPSTIQVFRRGKTFAYELADTRDWAVLFENAVLEIKATDGATYYWPLDSVTHWKVKDHAVA